MKKLTILLALLCFASVAFAATSYTDVTPATTTVTGSTGNAGEMNDRAVTFWAIEGDFMAAFPTLGTEDFSGTIVGPGAIVSCDGAFNSATNNACFTPGAILEGISIDCVSATDNVVLGDGAIGNVGVWVGPNTFSDDMLVSFDPVVNAFGFILEMPMGAGDVQMDVYDENNALIGSQTIVGSTGTFVGISSDSEGISYVSYYAPNDGAELLSTVYFGNCIVTPTEVSTFSSIKTLY